MLTGEGIKIFREMPLHHKVHHWWVFATIYYVNGCAFFWYVFFLFLLFKNHRY